ncbi:hypothetical protein KFE80_00865 [bacterium SCSIO 12696]|nr:hypothetical protein KFE80_00865 [bacterium SCSIO 12696]
MPKPLITLLLTVLIALQSVGSFAGSDGPHLQDSHYTGFDLSHHQDDDHDYGHAPEPVHDCQSPLEGCAAPECHTHSHGAHIVFILPTELSWSILSASFFAAPAGNQYLHSHPESLLRPPIS